MMISQSAGIMHAASRTDPYGREHGLAFLGENGTLVLDRNGWEVIPRLIQHPAWKPYRL
jgi:hypothetical protein